MNLIVLAFFLQLIIGPPGQDTQRAPLTKNDMPPAVSFKITDAELATLTDEEAEIRKAEGALADAKIRRSATERNIIEAHRPKGLPPADCQYSTSAYFTAGYGVPMFYSAVPNGYLAEINGNWVVFTRGFATCRGL